MSAGPWLQAELMRMVRKSERAKFYRAMKREEKHLLDVLPGSLAQRIIADAFDRIRSAIAPKAWPKGHPKARDVRKLAGIRAAK